MELDIWERRFTRAAKRFSVRNISETMPYSAERGSPARRGARTIFALGYAARSTGRHCVLAQFAKGINAEN